MKKCDFCGGLLETRVEKGFVESYGVNDITGASQKGHMSDLVVDLTIYEYCIPCDCYYHQGLILDGRNTLEVNLILLKKQRKNESKLSLIEVFEKMDLIYFNGSQILELFKLIE